MGRGGRDHDDGVSVRRRLVRENIEHDDCHVVDTAALQRQSHELVRRPLDVGLVEQDVGDLLFVKLVREAVAAKQKATAGHEVELPAVGLDPGLDPERPV